MCRFEFGDALLDARLRFCRVLLALACGRGRVLACGGLVVGLGLDKPCFAACDGDEVQDALLVGRFRVFAGVGQFGFEFGDTCVSRGQRIGIGVASVAIIAPSVAIILGVADFRDFAVLDNDCFAVGHLVLSVRRRAVADGGVFAVRLVNRDRVARFGVQLVIDGLRGFQSQRNGQRCEGFAKHAFVFAFRGFCCHRILIVGY